MSDTKSKLPDLKELASMTNKLLTDIKTSVSQIIHTYKENRAPHPEHRKEHNKPPVKKAKPEIRHAKERTVTSKTNTDEDLKTNKDKK